MDKLTDNHSSILKNIREDQGQKGWWEISNKLREEKGIPQRPPSQNEGKRKSEIRKLLHGKMLEMLKNGSENKTKAKSTWTTKGTQDQEREQITWTNATE